MDNLLEMPEKMNLYWSLFSYYKNFFLLLLEQFEWNFMVGSNPPLRNLDFFHS